VTPLLQMCGDGGAGERGPVREGGAAAWRRRRPTMLGPSARRRSPAAPLQPRRSAHATLGGAPPPRRPRTQRSAQAVRRWQLGGGRLAGGAEGAGKVDAVPGTTMQRRRRPKAEP
jgi:hypothetical protein